MSSENADIQPADRAEIEDAGAGDPTVVEIDLSLWRVPAICKDCGKDFTLPYRLFKAGVVFHCPHCRGSFVPTLPMYRAVRDAFETFYAQQAREPDKSILDITEQATLSRKQATERKAFLKTVDELARTMRPAGKMVKPKGIRAMFT